LQARLGKKCTRGEVYFIGRVVKNTKKFYNTVLVFVTFQLFTNASFFLFLFAANIFIRYFRGIDIYKSWYCSSCTIVIISLLIMNGENRTSEYLQLQNIGGYIACPWLYQGILTEGGKISTVDLLVLIQITCFSYWNYVF